MNEFVQKQLPVAYDTEIDLREMFRALRTRKWLTKGITFSASLIAVIVALLHLNIFRAEALLAPNDQERAGGLSSLAAQYGVLAILARIKIGKDSSDKIALGFEIIQSRPFLSGFKVRHDILEPLFAVTGWRPAADELKINLETYDLTARTWVRGGRPPINTIPSMQRASRAFSDVLPVTQDYESGSMFVAVEHYSPGIATQC